MAITFQYDCDTPKLYHYLCLQGKNPRGRTGFPGRPPSSTKLVPVVLLKICEESLRPSEVRTAHDDEKSVSEFGRSLNEVLGAREPQRVSVGKQPRSEPREVVKISRETKSFEDGLGVSRSPVFGRASKAFGQLVQLRNSES